MSGNATPTTFNYSGGVTTYSVPDSGEFQITAAGAQGGAGNLRQSGGLGAVTKGVFVLSSGATLMIVPGGMGGHPPLTFTKLGGGGGGGSYVIETKTGFEIKYSGPNNFKDVNIPLEIAGGGGGAGGYAAATSSSPFPDQGSSINAQTGPAGANGSRIERTVYGSSGGINGDGGRGASYLYGGGGGGVSGGVAGGFLPNGAGSGGSYANLNLKAPNFTGGVDNSGAGSGGFGGGGGASGGGGGGGGYGGGGGGENNVIFAGSGLTDTGGNGGGGGSLNIGSNPSVSVGNQGNGSITISPVTTATPPINNGQPSNLLVLPESGAVTVAGAQFITTDTGAKLVDTSSGDPVVALGAGNSTLIGGGGNSTVVCDGGNDVYGFLNGHAGGQQDIYNFNSTDQLAFGGYTGDPIMTEAVGSTGDLIQLTDGTIINLVGVNHTVFS
jgi:hypothetical protein